MSPSPIVDHEVLDPLELVHLDGSPTVKGDFATGSFASMLACLSHVRLGGNFGNAVVWFCRLKASVWTRFKRPTGLQIMRYELTDFEWVLQLKFEAD